MHEKHIHQCLSRLLEAARVASLPAEEQVQMFSPGLNVPYEIADDVGHWLQWTLEVSKIDLSAQQHNALSDLESKLHSMSGPENEELWTDEALHGDPHWVRVRTLASRVVACTEELLRNVA